MPAQSSTTRSRTSLLSTEARAEALWTYVHLKAPRFTREDALQVVRDLGLSGNEDVKSLAKRLRVALLAHGVNLKHMNALQAASRLRGDPSFYSDRGVRAPQVRLTTFYGEGLGIAEGTFPSWNELTEFVRQVVDELVSNQWTPLGVLRVQFTGTAFEFTAPAHGDVPDDKARVLETPVFRVEGLVQEWLEGAPAFVEKIRRHLEERGQAVLNGAEVIHLCADQPPPRGSPSEVSLADAPNSELVLVREDLEDDPSSWYEIARGDEITCWHQLELSMRDDRTNTMPVLEISVPVEGSGAWFVNGRRYIWALETLHPKEYVPGRSTQFIGPHKCDRLLRRYKLAKAIHGGAFKHHPLNKRLAYLSGVPDTYRVDLHYLLRLLHDAGLTWEQCAEEFLEDPLQLQERPLQLQQVLPVGFVFQVLQKLQVQDPNKVFALPNISETARVDDDGLLRALLPRVQSVRAVRPWGLSEEQKQALNEALETFGAGRRLQVLYADGGIRSEQELRTWSTRATPRSFAAR